MERSSRYGLSLCGPRRTVKMSTAKKNLWIKTLEPGGKVLAWWRFKWYKAEVVKVEDGEHPKTKKTIPCVWVHYTGFTRRWDEWQIDDCLIQDAPENYNEIDADNTWGATFKHEIKQLPSNRKNRKAIQKRGPVREVTLNALHGLGKSHTVSRTATSVSSGRTTYSSSSRNVTDKSDDTRDLQEELDLSDETVDQLVKAGFTTRTKLLKIATSRRYPDNMSFVTMLFDKVALEEYIDEAVKGATSTDNAAETENEDTQHELEGSPNSSRGRRSSRTRSRSARPALAHKSMRKAVFSRKAV